jgi:hypothetical protein
MMQMLNPEKSNLKSISAWTAHQFVQRLLISATCHHQDKVKAFEILTF